MARGRLPASSPHHALARQRGAVRWLLAALLAAVCLVAVAQSRSWMGLASDGLHDPQGSAIGVLQEPANALEGLPPDAVGNQVRWVQALDEGAITPRTNILPETKVNLRLTDVLLKNTGEMPMVRFPHRQHTAWLDCTNCHGAVGLFEEKAGASTINMMLILSGEKCGLCHGAVSFPLTECKRCHNVQRGSPEHQAFNKGLVLEGTPP